MICPVCDGKGFEAKRRIFTASHGDYTCLYEPCSTCQGSGVAYCCEGELEDGCVQAVPPQAER